ncbi:MAG: beta-propeller fold lactonase family protein [Acidimicrobiales bacterium]
MTATEPSESVGAGPAVFFNSGRVDVSTQGTLGPTGSVTSTATLNAIGVGVNQFHATSASSTCTASQTGVTASTTIVGGIVDTATDANGNVTATQAVPTMPAVGLAINGTIVVGASNESFTYIFNEQTTNPDGSITVTAVHLVLHGPFAKGDLYVGQSTCGATPVSVTTQPSTTTTQPSTTTTTRPPAAVSPRAYVANANSNTVSVIDTATNTVVATVAVGSFPIAVAVNPAGTRAYVANANSNDVSVIDTATNTVVAIVAVPAGAFAVAVNPAGTRAYVANGDSNNGIVSVIDTATNTVVATVAVGLIPEGVAVSPDGTRAYVTNEFDSTVSVIDTATNTVVATVAVDGSPIGVAVNPAGTRVYVGNQGSNDVSVIDTATNTVVATVFVDGAPAAVAVNPAGTRAYVANYDSNDVSVIDTATNTVVATVAVGAGPEGVAVTPDGTRAYVTNSGDNTVSVINTATNTVVGTIVVGTFPFGVAMGPAPKPTPTVATQASPGNLLGAPVRDTATVSGGSSPTGSVTFKLFSDAGCATQVFTSTNPVGAGSATSDAFTPTAAGTYRFIASYSGDANNNPVTSACGAANESVVIAPFTPPPPTRTVTGDFLGPLTVNAGESMVITNARVVGPVTVNPGGSLTVVNSQISRGIVANGPSFFSVCGSQISGPSTTPGQGIVVSGATVPIRIGDPATGCALNRVAGDVTLTGNTAGLTLGANIVSGNVTVNNNTVGTDVVKANNVFKALACAGNAPAPTNAGQPNTASSKSGQCVGL